MEFTPDKPPKSGNAIKLWRWWQAMNGESPRSLVVCRFGAWRKACGAPSYVINGRYLVYSVPDALKQTMADAQADPGGTDDYFFD